MASVSITSRTTKCGEKRHVVRYRLSGKAWPLVHAGSFKTLREAKVRRDLVAGEIAAGRNPAVRLAELKAPPVRRTLTACFDEFMASRIDVGFKTQGLNRNGRDRLRSLAKLDPNEVTPSHVVAWVAENSTASDDYSALAPKSLRHYLSTLCQVLDYCDVTPNPTRSPKVRLAEKVAEEVAPPSAGEWDVIKANLSRRGSLVVRVIECESVRVSEALQLTYGDVDFAGGRVRVSKARTKGRTAGQRWLPVPADLLDEISDLVPLEDRRADRRVFANLTDSQVRDGLARACRDAGIAHYHPHNLRDRRSSLWIAQGIDAVQAKTWSGHSKGSRHTRTALAVWSPCGLRTRRTAAIRLR